MEKSLEISRQKWRGRWSVVMAVVITFNLVALPFRLAFIVPDPLSPLHSLFQMTDALSFVLYWMDITWNYIYPYLKHSKQSSSNNRLQQKTMQFRQYVTTTQIALEDSSTKSGFYIDIIAAMPLSYLMQWLWHLPSGIAIL
jgi:hypothetical protein